MARLGETDYGACNKARRRKVRVWHPEQVEWEIATAARLRRAAGVTWGAVVTIPGGQHSQPSCVGGSPVLIVARGSARWQRYRVRLSIGGQKQARAWVRPSRGTYELAPVNPAACDRLNREGLSVSPGEAPTPAIDSGGRRRHGGYTVEEAGVALSPLNVDSCVRVLVCRGKCAA
ncbi:hypothetical protein Pcinc_015840 [Petrolisthes cinctipes]|uniref:Uncharacterized protein n=1 Tax=Petrolisthes cinctipes TaxID=88211 RepID=A0AAE1KPC1_PETCI|nr:hypothetical protein Pcinc_015840 [Petrolisthes cinctipes]